jgi:hypothetical protein
MLHHMVKCGGSTVDGSRPWADRLAAGRLDRRDPRTEMELGAAAAVTSAGS